ncbi:MAG TPA: aminotransferase class I/II-fold pyridoxal phosphate-dependent enzyme [Pseudomonadales bacterium]
MNLIERRIATEELPWQGANVLGKLVVVDGGPTTGVVDGHEVILAGTNNYLGLTFHPDCVRAATEAVERYGTGTTGSRLASGTYPDHAALERELAEFYDARTAMVFTTGYQANVGIISALADRDSVLVLDAQSHASIYDGATLAGATTYRFKHNDVVDLDKKLRRLGDKAANALVIVEGIYSMLGDTAPLAEICEVTTRYGAALLVDEAHSFGVLGKHGRGLAEAVGAEDQVDVIVGTFSKSLGCVGGYAVSRKHDLGQLRAAARSYAYSASSSPSVMASARAALKVIREHPELRERLLSNARVTYGALQQLGFELGPEITPIVGVHVRDRERALDAWRYLIDHGVYVNLVPPEASPGPFCLLRVSLSAAHTPQQIEGIIEAFRALKESGPLRTSTTV